MTEHNIELTDFTKQPEDNHTVWNLVRHEFTGIIRTTDKAYLLKLVNKPNYGLWVPKSMLIGLTINPINKHIVVYIPDFCNSKEVSLMANQYG